MRSKPMRRATSPRSSRASTASCGMARSLRTAKYTVLGSAFSALGFLCILALCLIYRTSCPQLGQRRGSAIALAWRHRALGQFLTPPPDSLTRIPNKIRDPLNAIEIVDSKREAIQIQGHIFQQETNSPFRSLSRCQVSHRGTSCGGEGGIVV